ncbi:MAG: FAD-binding oxidoreductase, partial [Granulosicoccus sp.]|nr:FAD-binding oxidoreductase [Granulosicoccus sp.]
TKSLNEAINCDVVIIGAGFTGLNAALELVLAGTKVVVLEAGELGVGSSGRSGGQVNIGLNLPPSALIQKFGAAQGERLVEAVKAAPDHVFNLIERFSLLCDAVRQGWVQAAASPAIFKEQQSMANDYQQFGVDMQILSPDELKTRTGSSSYAGGLFSNIAGSIQPLSYTRSLARVAMENGAQIFTESGVNSLQKLSNGWSVKTASGVVNANQVLVCTNAYTQSTMNTLRKTVVPVRSILVATEPLSQGLQQQILPGKVTFVDKRRLILYMRYDRDGRLCVGDHGPSRDHFKLSDFDLVKKRATAAFPQLKSVKWEYHWGGRVAMTKDALPFMHEIAPGMLAGMGYNGRGVAMGSLMGKLLANQLISGQSGEMAFPMTKPDTFKLHAFHKLGVAATVSWYTLQDYLNRVGSK